MRKLIVLILVLIMQSSLVASVSATEFGFKDTLRDFQKGVEEISEDLGDEDRGTITLPTFAEDEDTEGAVSIAAAIDRFLDLFLLFVAPLAVLTMVIQGLKLVTGGRESEEVATKAKKYIRYAIEGLIVIFVANQIVDVIFGPTGEIFRTGEAGAKEFGRQTSQFFEGLYSLIQVLIGSVAVFILVMAGMRYVAGSASEEQIGKAKKQITWALIGLFVIGVSEFVAKDVIFQQQGRAIGTDQAKQLFAQVTNFAAGTIGTLSFAFLLYAGYLYVTAAGNEEQSTKAKKIIIGAFIGILLAAAAFAITTTIVDLDAAR